MRILSRYSKITEKFPREMVLLQGTGCAVKNKCLFCDYYLDRSGDPFGVNSPVIDFITGEFGVLDVINSGSVQELDIKTMNKIKETLRIKNINKVWFEAHWMYRNRKKEIVDFFEKTDVKFRTGIETFNYSLRKSWGKDIPKDVGAEDVAEYFDGVCLLVGLEGQTLEDIVSDIETADKYFEYFNVNVFNKNTKKQIQRNESLINDFVEKIYPNLLGNKKAEVLISATNLGVG